MNLKKYLDDIERNPLGHLIAALHEGPELHRLARAQYEADARALWAVRVLDRWAKGSKALEWRVTDCSEQVCCTLQRTVNGGQVADTDYYGPTPDAARIAAAEALVKDDETLDPNR